MLAGGNHWGRAHWCVVLFLCAVVTIAPAGASIFGTVRGIVHDPDHRPVPGAVVALSSSMSGLVQETRTNAEGEFNFGAVPVGDYEVTASSSGFAALKESLRVASRSSPVVHLQLRLESRAESVEVSGKDGTVNPESFTPTTVIDRTDIVRTPGADRTNSMAMITSFVPGAYVVHDQLHVRGGHQVTWMVDGVPVPNNSIATNAGPQFDPKDIEDLEVLRGAYSAEYGDRTYGVFNIVPRSGFERENEAELVMSYGSFHQTNDQLSFGSHTPRFAWYASVNGNRSDLGLQTPTPEVAHDRAWGLGGFASLILNAGPKDQLRLVTAVRRDDYQVPDSGEDRERDAFVNFSWVRAPRPGVLLTVSPFYHFNQAEFAGGPASPAVNAQDRQDSQYAGAQVSLSGVTKRHNARVGVYAYHQQDLRMFSLASSGESGAALSQTMRPSANLEALFLEEQFTAASWLRLSGGVRLTHYGGVVSENAASPRAGAALTLPRLRWVVRGFYGRYYQAPPLATVSGPVLGYAVVGFLPLKGERNEEKQFGVAMPLRGWVLDADYFLTRTTNLFDHQAVGNSNVFLPLTIGAGRVEGWELTLNSPLLFRRGRMHLAYSSQVAQGRGPVTGGLTDFSPPKDSPFPLDHDQRHTLSVGSNAALPRGMWFSANLYYGSGFPDQGGPARLAAHTTFDLSAGKSFSARWSVSLNVINVANRHFLLDNSETFGGTHYSDPRQIYAQVRYRFKYR